jgi:hypothetical protein
MRAALAEQAPRGVLGTLGRLDDDAAWRLRERLASHEAEVLASLRWLDGARAWDLREAYLRRRGGDPAMADPLAAGPMLASLRGLGGDRAWALRRLAADVLPVDVLASLAGLADDEAWGWRERLAARAGKVAFRTIVGDPSPRAWALRAAHVDTVKEALDSMAGLPGPEGWAIRERAAGRWPSTVVKSIGGLVTEPRGRELAERLLSAYPDNPSLLKHAARLALGRFEPVDG